MLDLSIRAAQEEDAESIWQVLSPTLRAGETYALPSDLPRAAALDYWCGPEREVFVALQRGVLVGTYFLRANQAGGGSHVANCGYMVAPAATGRGIAQAMCQHSLALAKERGFLAMQFTFVISSNERAVRLWQHFGFSIAGRLPRAFRHPTAGFVDALVMHRQL
jgi:ribosomal protein S18 acetylase RimI-like enzyme